MLRRVSSRVVGGNLRSWALVLRAGDGRLARALRMEGDPGSEVVVTGADVRAWCGPVAIEPPGVSLDAAARLFGVTRTTVSRWADPPPEVGEGDGVGLARDAKRPADLGGRSARYAAEPAHRGHGGAVKTKRVTWRQAIDRQVVAAREAAAGERFGAASSYRVYGRRLVLDYTVNRANRKRDGVRVWTPMAYGVDPGGEVWSADWGLARRRLVGLIPEGFEQRLGRHSRRLGAYRGVEEWECPAEDGGCGRLASKLYLPMPVWTIGAVFSEAEASRCRGEAPGSGGGVGVGDAGWDGGRFASRATPGEAWRFLCRRCCGLVYESSERTSSPGIKKDGSRRGVDVWDRYVKRISGGVLRGADVVRGEGGSAWDCEDTGGEPPPA